MNYYLLALVAINAIGIGAYIHFAAKNAETMAKLERSTSQETMLKAYDMGMRVLLEISDENTPEYAMEVAATYLKRKDSDPVNEALKILNNA